MNTSPEASNGPKEISRRRVEAKRDLNYPLITAVGLSVAGLIGGGAYATKNYLEAREQQAIAAKAKEEADAKLAHERAVELTKAQSLAEIARLTSATEAAINSQTIAENQALLETAKRKEASRGRSEGAAWVNVLEVLPENFDEALRIETSQRRETVQVDALREAYTTGFQEGALTQAQTRRAEELALKERLEKEKLAGELQVSREAQDRLTGELTRAGVELENAKKIAAGDYSVLGDNAKNVLISFFEKEIPEFREALTPEEYQAMVDHTAGGCRASQGPNCTSCNNIVMFEESYLAADDARKTKFASIRLDGKITHVPNLDPLTTPYVNFSKIVAACYPDDPEKAKGVRQFAAALLEARNR
ncbi:MAG: hypothetical protein AB7J40_03230 [Candidatus Altimarinota bacterium]